MPSLQFVFNKVQKFTSKISSKFKTIKNKLMKNKNSLEPSKSIESTNVSPIITPLPEPKTPISEIYNIQAKTPITQSEYIQSEYAAYILTACIILCAIIISSLYIKRYKKKLSTFKVAQFLIFTGWIIDFVFTWQKLYQMSEVDKFVDKIALNSVADSCDTSKLNMWEKMMKFLKFQNKCKQYHHLTFNNSLWSIGPITVLSEQLLLPAKNIGIAFGNIINGILNSLPWGLNIILLPILLIFLSILICIFISYFTQTNFELNLLYIIKIKFSNDDREKIRNIIPNFKPNNIKVNTKRKPRHNKKTKRKYLLN